MKDGTFVIPQFGDSILRSITSVTVLDLAAAGYLKARQEVVRIDAFLDAVKSGEIIEAGGFGTAAVVSPVGEYVFEDGAVLKVGDGTVGAHSTRLYDLYTAMQTGKTTAPAGWLERVKEY
jgi:branched-chain amino acid aminotransferase